MLDNMKTEKVCELKKALYGLKQTWWSWNQKLNTTLKMFEAIHAHPTHTFIESVNGRKIITYADDLIVASKNDEKIAGIHKKLRKLIETNYLGKMDVASKLNLPEARTFCVWVRKDTSMKSGMTHAKPPQTPMDWESNWRIQKKRRTRIWQHLIVNW